MTRYTKNRTKGFWFAWRPVRADGKWTWLRDVYRIKYREGGYSWSCYHGVPA